MSAPFDCPGFAVAVLCRVRIGDGGGRKVPATFPISNAASSFSWSTLWHPAGSRMGPGHLSSPSNTRT